MFKGKFKTQLNSARVAAGILGWMALLIIVSDQFSELTPQASSSCSSPNFSAPATFPTGKDSNIVAVGDFNEDGKRDLIVANSFILVNDASLLLGDGAGSFGAAKHFPVGPKPVFVATGDFNGDDNLDFVTANSGVNSTTPGALGTVTVRLGDGNGDFAPAINTAAGYAPSSLVPGDFNNDGRLDLAVGNAGYTIISEAEVKNFPASVSILLGDAAGGFSLSNTFEFGGLPPLSIAAGDLNGDGDLDLVVTTRPGISIMKGNGAGTFTVTGNLAVTGTPVHVVLGDFNRDGKLDLVTADGFADGHDRNTISIRLGDNTGNFGAASSSPVATNPLFAGAGDFNLDGNLDLAVANGGGVFVTVGDGSGGFAPPTSYTGEYRTVATGDFNNDTKLDLALTSAHVSNLPPGFNSNVSILLNNCGAPTPTPSPLVLTVEGSSRAVALDSVTVIRDPFPFISTTNFSSDQRTRIILFAMNIDLQAGEDAASVTARLENSEHAIFSIPAEYVGKVPKFSWLTQVNVRLPDELAKGGDVWMSLIYHGVESNKALITIKPPAN